MYLHVQKCEGRVKASNTRIFSIDSVEVIGEFIIVLEVCQSDVLQHTTPLCNTPQHTATHRNTPKPCSWTLNPWWTVRIVLSGYNLYDERKWKPICLPEKALIVSVSCLHSVASFVDCCTDYFCQWTLKTKIGFVRSFHCRKDNLFLMAWYINPTSVVVYQFLCNTKQNAAALCNTLQYIDAQQPSDTHCNTKAFLYLHNSLLQAGLETEESSFEHVYGSLADIQLSFSLCKRTKPTQASSCKNSFLEFFSFQYRANGLLMFTIERNRALNIHKRALFMRKKALYQYDRKNDPICFVLQKEPSEQ